MKKIHLKRLTVENIKGIKNLTFEFNEGETNIHGVNGCGKTTLNDSYTWLLYGKNSQDQKDFLIKTVDSNNKVIHNLEHSVEGLFIIDSEEVLLKRSYREKWTKKRGFENSELTGHESSFFINEVPSTLIEFSKKVDSILEEKLQKILSNPLYFNTQLKWTERRLILSELVGNITDDEILNTLSPEHKTQLQELISSNKTLEEYKREYVAKRKKIKDELDLIPSRIDEVSKSIPEAKNWSEIEQEISIKKLDIQTIDSKIEDYTKAMEGEFKKVTDAKAKLFEKQQELTTLNNKVLADSKKDLNDQKSIESDLTHEISLHNTTLKQINESIKLASDQITSIEAETTKLRQDLQVENSKTLEIDPSSISCPTCKRDYESDKIESIKTTLESNFNESKLKTTNEIRSKGKSNNDKVAECKTLIEGFDKQKTELEQTISQKTDKLKLVSEKVAELSKVEPVKTEAQIALEKEIALIVIPEVKPIDNSELKNKKSELQVSIDELQKILHDKPVIEKANDRIVELNGMQKKYSQEIASFEKVEMCIDLFNKTKIELIEQRVNSKFKFVKFKMFEQQLNGGENPVCEALIDGVNFSDANTASKINAGLDVISTLQSFYGVSSPVWIDGRESITNIMQMDCQVVSLIVDSSCDVLTVK